jgi:hypothetical protein
MSTVPTGPSGQLSREAVLAQVEQLSAVYQLSKFFSGNGDANSFKQAGIFRLEEQAQLDWIARDPNIRQLLDDYESNRQEMIRLDRESVSMWGDGSQSTKEQREAYLEALTYRKGLNAVTANIYGAIGGEIGRLLYPNDPEYAANVASFIASEGEVFNLVGEPVLAGRENSEYRPGEEGMQQYAPGKLTEKPENPFEATFTKSKPVGSDSYNPYQTEVESPEVESPEGDDDSEEPDGSEVTSNNDHFDGGVPMGTLGDDFQDQAFPSRNDQPEGVEPSAGPNQSILENDAVNQSVPEEPTASFPEDLYRNQNQNLTPLQPIGGDRSSTITDPDFPNDPIVNSSLPTSSQPSYISEPQSVPTFSSQPIQSVPVEPVPMESLPSGPISSEPPPIAPFYTEPTPSPEALENIAPNFDPG